MVSQKHRLVWACACLMGVIGVLPYLLAAFHFSDSPDRVFTAITPDTIHKNGRSTGQFDETFAYAPLVQCQLRGDWQMIAPGQDIPPDTPSINSMLAVLPATLIAILCGDVGIMLMVCDFVFLVLLFLLLYAWCWQLTSSRIGACLAAAWGLAVPYGFYDLYKIFNQPKVVLLNMLGHSEASSLPITRMVTPEITLSYLLLAFLMLLRMNRKPESAWWPSALCCGSLFYVYFYYCPIIIMFLFFLVVFHWRNHDRERTHCFLKILGGTAVLGLPYFHRLLQVVNHPHYEYMSMTHGLVDFSLSLDHVARSPFFFYALLFLLLYPSAKQNLTFLYLRALLLACLLCFYSHWVTGIDLQAWHYVEYLQQPLLPTFFVVLLLHLKRYFPQSLPRVYQGWQSRLYTFLKERQSLLGCVLIGMALLIGAARQSRHVMKEDFVNYYSQDKNEKMIFDHINEHYPEPQHVLCPNFDTTLRLGAMTKHYPYLLPGARSLCLSYQDAVTRYFESLGLVQTSLMEVEARVNKKYSLDTLWIFNVGATQERKNQLVKQYQTFMEKPWALSYPCDLVLLTPSEAKELAWVEEKELLFQAGDYRLYRW